MFGAIVSALTSGVLGTIFGQLGNLVNQWFQKKQIEMKYKHEKDMAKINIDMLRAKTDASIKIVQAEVQGKVDLADAGAFAYSQQVGNQRNFSDKWMDSLLSQEGWLRYISVPAAFMLMCLFAIVDFLKALMRPGLTLYFTTLSSLLTWKCYDIIQKANFEAITQEMAVLYFTIAVDTCIMLTTTCVSWWFGDRRMAKFLSKMNESRLSIHQPPRSPEPTEEEE
jgi:hypothetical protein